MIRIPILFLLILIVTRSYSINYFVDAVNGNNTNTGLSSSAALNALWKAAEKTEAGDTVFVMNGTYLNTGTNPVVTETSSGTAGKWIVWMNFPGHKPVLTFNGWQGFYIKGSYVEINGLTIRGNNANLTLEQALNQPKSCNVPTGSVEGKYNGNGIYADGRTNTRVHHLKVKNCIIYECGGGGIQTIQTDYITLENNTIYNNAWYSIYAPSGISLYQNWNSDNETGTKNIIRNNRCYGNRMFVPWPGYQCRFTDGNGIILDDFENTQNGSKLGSYKGRTLVENNLVYNNGGSGIHCFHCKHIDIINNTAYKNSQTPEIDNGEIFAQNSDDVRIFNNILYADENNKINSNMSNGSSVVYDYNLHFGGTTAALTGNHTVVGDPLFFDATNGNFQLKSGSQALNTGIASFFGSAAPTNDFKGNSRPFGSGIDLGAYEFNTATAINDFNLNERNSLFSLYPNPTSGHVNIKLFTEIDVSVNIKIIDPQGKTLSAKSFSALAQAQNIFQMTTPFPAGLYLVELNIGQNIQSAKLLIK